MLEYTTKDKNAIVEELIDYVHSRFPEADLSPGQVFRDILIEPIAEYFDNIYSTIQAIDIFLNLNNLEDFLQNPIKQDEFMANINITREELDTLITSIINLYAENYNISRKPPTNSTGLLTFYVDDPAPLGAFTIPAGTRCLLKDSELSFITTQTINISSSTDWIYNSLENRFERTVPAQSEFPGSINNVGRYSIQVIDPSSNLPGALGVTNTVSFTGGSDEESDISVLGRIKLALSGNFSGTASSILSKATSYSGVKDAYIEKQGSPNIPLVVMIPSSATKSESFTMTERKPYQMQELAEEIISLIRDGDIISELFYNISFKDGKSYIDPKYVKDYINIYNGVGYSFHYTINQNGSDIAVQVSYNTKILYLSDIYFDVYINDTKIDPSRISITTQDNESTIHITNVDLSSINTFGLMLDLTNGSYEVTYKYNSIATELYNYLNSDSQLFCGQKIEVKLASPRYLHIDVLLQISENVSSSDVINQATTEISKYIDSLKLGPSVDMITLITKLKSIHGVIDIKIPFNVFYYTNHQTQTTDVVSDFTLNPDEYLVPGDIVINTTTATVVNRG